MLRGDLASNPLRQLLPELAADEPTGCLYVADPLGGELHLYLDAGQLCGVRPSPERDPLGDRLVADGVLGADEVARYRPADERSPSMAERLIETDRVSRDEIERRALDLALDTIDVACGWSTGAYRFRRRQRPGLALPDPITIVKLLTDLAARDREQDVSDHEAGTTPPGAWNRLADEAEVTESLAKVSRAVSEALGDLADEVEPETTSVLIRPSASAVDAPPVDPETKARRDRLRAAAAAELAAAHAEAEEERRATAAAIPAANAARPAEPTPTAEVVDLTARREAARAARAAGDARRGESARQAGAPVIQPEDPLGLSTTEPAPKQERAAEAAPARKQEPAPERPWAQSSGDQHYAATALLREMAGNDSSAPTPATSVPAPAPEPSEPAEVPAARLHRPTTGGDADTAALLRELSSLGGDEAAPRSAPVTPTRPSQTTTAPPRKRKGLWGRG